MNAGLTSPSISPRTFTSSGHLRFREQRKNIFPGEADLVKVTTSLTNAQDIPAYGVWASIPSGKVPLSSTPGVPEVCSHRNPGAASIASLYRPIFSTAPTL